jgi:hypothetical protein
LYRHIKALVDQNPFSCRKLIDESIALSEWIFKSEDSGTAHLYRSDCISLVFDGRTGNLIMTSKQTGESLVERDAETVLGVINQIPARDFVVQSYDFRVPLAILLQAIAQMRAPSAAALRCCAVSG